MNAAQTNAAETSTGRDEKGQFTPGNPGGPGNPFARQVAALRKALVDAVTPQDIQEVAAALIARAKEGNVQAAKLLLSYAIGKPEQAPQPDHLDAHEWEIYRATTPMKEEAAAVTKAGDPEFHLRTVRVVRPLITQMMQNTVNDMFNETPEQRIKREAAEAAEAQRRMQSMSPDWDFPHPGPSPYGNNGGAPPTPNGKKRSAPTGQGG